jgi:hypothetical protein
MNGAHACEPGAPYATCVGDLEYTVEQFEIARLDLGCLRFHAENPGTPVVAGESIAGTGMSGEGEEDL